tara:strand:- start:49 stop:1329 length:1281 start_codon:yes stop_codon:yes gene_type:complete
MRRYQKYFKRILNIIISGSLRHIIFRLIGLDNYISLILKAADHRGNQRAQKNILCIERTIFEKDINELSYRVRKYGWIWLRKNQITVYQTPILPKSHLTQRKYIDKIKEAPNQWEECIKRSKILMKRFQREKNVCALMLGNLDYWQDYTLREACIELGIPVLILAKEYPYNSLKLIDNYLDYYKEYKPNADAIMVFGKRMKEAFSRLDGFDKNKIFITGSPRIDRWRSIENTSKSTYEGLVIISFMFGEYNKKTFLDLLHKISLYFKNENLGKMTVKSREQGDHQVTVNYCKKEGLKNVDVIQNISIHDLVSHSKAIIALNSLATIESMLSVKPILVPDWLIEQRDEKLFDPNDKLSQTVVKLCIKEQDLLDNISRIFKNKNSNITEECIVARKEFIAKFWEYDDKISASSKVQGVIDKFVEGVSS